MILLNSKITNRITVSPCQSTNTKVEQINYSSIFFLYAAKIILYRFTLILIFSEYLIFIFLELRETFDYSRFKCCVNWGNKKNNITGRNRLFVSPTTVHHWIIEELRITN